MSKYPQLDEYIKKEKLKGKTEDQLRVEMKGAGYNEDDLKEIFPNEDGSFTPTSAPSNDNVSLNKKNKAVYIPLFVLFLLLVGGVFYFWNTGVFAGAPYSQNNLFSGLAQKISKMETYSYSFSGSFISEEREKDAEPFVSSGNTIELKEKYNRDYQRVQFVNRFYAVYSRKSLENLESGTDSFINITDPLTGEVYNYKLTEGGENWEISIKFETSEAIKSARNNNERVLEWGTTEPVDINDQTITFTKKTSSISFPSKPPQNFYESINSSLASVPEDIDIKAAVSFKSDENSNFAVDLSAEGDLGDLIYKVDANAIKKDEEIYLRINNFPSLFLMFMPLPKEEWILIDEDSFLGDLIPGKEFAQNEESKEEINKFYRNALVLADKNNLLDIINNPSKEKIDGNVAYKYELEINKGGLKPFLDDIINEIKSGEYNKTSDYLTDLENLRDYVNGKEFDSVLDYYNKNTKNTLWVNKNGYIVKFENSNRLVPDSEILDDKQFILTLAIELEDINKEVNIEAPSNYKTLEEIENSYDNPLNSTRDKGSDAAIKANLNNIRAQAELAYDSNNNSYGGKPFTLGVCRPEKDTLFAESNIANAIESASSYGQEDAKCVSEMINGKVQSWSISVPLVSDSDYSYCVDSSGNAIEIVGEIKGDTCDGGISKKKDNSPKIEVSTVKESIKVEPSFVKVEDFSGNIVSYSESAFGECRDEYNYDYGPSPEIDKNREECYKRVMNNIFDEQKKIELANYNFCGTSFEIESKSFKDSFNYIDDIAGLYSDLANKEDSKLFCEEFKTFFYGHKVGILLDNFHFDPGGFDYKDITFYKLFDEKIVWNNFNNQFGSSLDFKKKEVRYLPYHNPGDYRKENPGGGYTTSNVVLGVF